MKSLAIKLLIVITAAIGIGSFLFHTFATRWTLILDLIPILLFQIIYFWLYSQRIMQRSTTFSILLLSSYLLLTELGAKFPEYFNGSLIYVPSLLLLLSFGLFHCRQNKTERWLLLNVFGLFLLSLSLRSADNELCPSIPIGTHFLWHISCGLIVYLTTRALLVNLDEVQIKTNP